MLGFVKRWIRTSRVGAAGLRVGRRHPALRRWGLSVFGNLAILSCRISAGGVAFDASKRTLVLVVHNASVSGAPILGLNLASQFSSSYNVIVMMLTGGALARELAMAGVAAAKPRFGSMREASAALLGYVVLARIRRAYGLDVVVANSVECAVAVAGANSVGVPCLSLIHEFAEYADPHHLALTVGHSDRIVFSAQIVANSVLSLHPIDDERRSVIPQGRSAVPSSRPATGYQTHLSRPIQPDEILCIGCGRAEMRKGTDLFISAAIGALKRSSKLRFLWVGEGNGDDRYPNYRFWLKNHISRSGSTDHIEFVPPLSGPDLQDLFRDAKIMFLSSRLDPLPNLAIDAMHEGVPVVCFEKATGLAEYLATDPVLKALIVPYLDTGAAVKVIVDLAQDIELRDAMSRSSLLAANSLFDMTRYVEKLHLNLTEILTKRAH